MRSGVSMEEDWDMKFYEKPATIISHDWRAKSRAEIIRPQATKEGVELCLFSEINTLMNI